MKRARVSLLGQAVCLTIGLALGSGIAVQAGAQWLPDRQYAEGPGIRLGELELHPGIAVRGGYDNNVFRSDGKTRTGPNGVPITNELQGAPILAVTPHLYLSTETAQRSMQGEDRGGGGPRFIGFRGGLSATYLHYFIDDAPRNVAIDTDLFLGIAQGRPVGVDLAVAYVRTVSPFTENARNGNAYVVDVLDPKLRLKFNSRGQVLTAYAGYSPRYNHYESGVFNYLNALTHTIDVGAAWRFLPSTALIYDASLGLQDYVNQQASDNLLLLYSNNQIFRTRLGVNGAVSNRINLRVLAGYATGFYKSTHLDEFEDVIGEAVLEYNFDPHRFDIGYQRDIQSSPVGAWYQTDRGFGKLSFMFARRFGLGFEAGAGRATYGRLVRVDGLTGEVVALGANGDTSREDLRIDGAVRMEYRATNWLSFMVDFTAQSVMTDFEYEVTALPDPETDSVIRIPDPASYSAMQVFGGVRAHY
jgi:hypothetical protein